MGYITVILVNCIYTWITLLTEYSVTYEIGNGISCNVHRISNGSFLQSNSKFNPQCLTTGSKPLRKHFLHRVRCSVSFFNLQSPLLSLRSSSSCRCLFTRLPVTSILPSVFPSITYFWRQFLPKMWPIQLPFLLFVAYRIFVSSLALCNSSTFFTGSVKLIFSILL